MNIRNSDCVGVGGCLIVESWIEGSFKGILHSQSQRIMRIGSFTHVFRGVSGKEADVGDHYPV